MALAKPSDSSKSKKLVRNPNTPSLKSQGAGYSTTNRKGETTFYKSSKDAAGYSDTNQSRSNMSKGQAISKFDSGGMVLNSTNIAPTTPINLPQKPAVEDLTSLTNSINSSLATGSQGASTYDATKGFVTTPTETTPDTATSTFNQMMEALGQNQESISGMNEKFVRAQQKEIKPYEQAVQSYQNQLNQITAKRDAEQLALEGQGRGITESIIGGQQAQIGREAAIQALPIQAQLSAAQGDLESARSYIGQLYTAKAADAKANYEYQASKIQSVYSFLTAQEAKVARAKELEQSRSWQVEDRNITLASNLAQTAMEFGQSTLAGKIMALNEKSPTFASDLATLQAQVQKPVAASKRDTQVINGQLVDMQTGEIIPIGGAGSSVPTFEDFITLKENQLGMSLMPSEREKYRAEYAGLVGAANQPSSDEMAYARQYATTGQIPAGLSTSGISFGRLAEIASDLPKPKGALVSRDTGVAPDLPATERVGYESLYTAINTDLKTMQSAWNEMQRTNLGGTGVVGGIAAAVAPSDAVTRYNTAKKEFLAKLLQARSGAAVTETEYNRYAKLVPNTFNTPLWMGTSGDKKLSNLDTQLNNTLRDKLASRGLSIYGYSSVDVGGEQLQIGEIITNATGQQGRVNPDGSVTLITQ